jgi:hypothetical protein
MLIKCRFAPRLLAAALVLGLTGAAAAADPTGKMTVSGAPLGPNSCSAIIQASERARGIPLNLLSAISLAESGRIEPDGGAIVAWPWTINAGGEGQFFDTKEEAIAEVKKLRAKGVTSIDVGCMQVNLHHHPDAFESLDTAFDPGRNVAYAAQFLKELRDDAHSWSVAVGLYHSATREFSDPYRSRVYRLWGEVRRRDAERKRQEVIAAYLERRAAAELARKSRRDPS